jgi:hypothetical protein
MKEDGEHEERFVEKKAKEMKQELMQKIEKKIK